MNEEQQEELESQQKIQQLETIARQVLTKEALQRYGNIKAAHPEKAAQLLLVIGQAVQSGQINKIDDDQLKEILIKLTPEKKDFKIRLR